MCDCGKVAKISRVVPWIVVCMFVGLLGGPAAQAWGCKGHQTVAAMAEKHLTPEARQMIEKLLSENPIDPKLRRWCGNATTDLVVDASTWPDDVRNERKNGPWHYIGYSAREAQRRAERVLRCGRMRDARHRRAARYPERQVRRSSKAS